MNDDELGRLLSGAFDERARDAVPDARPVPPPRFTDDAVSPKRLTPGRRWSAGRLALPLSAAAAVVVLVTLVLAVVGHGSTGGHVPSGLGRDPAAPSTTNLAEFKGSGAPVHIKLLNADGGVVGVGMPVIAYLSKPITDARALQAATDVTVDGAPTTADWYVERSTAVQGYPYEAHLRPRDYWPAHASVHVGLRTNGLTAGKGMVFDDSLTLDFRTGAEHVVLVDDRTHMLTLDTDGTKQLSYPVSLGAAGTPTARGIKVIMEKGDHICMSGPGYEECNIKYTQRLTYDGEYLHAAPWNTEHIRNGIDSSNGCTNLLPGDAKELFSVLRVGDVVDYPDANGPAMRLGSGFGDWNVGWTTWLTGGLAPTH